MFVEISFVFIAILYSNFIEWAFHKYILHGLGKKRSSFWNFHWGEHHLSATRHQFRDQTVYWKEIIALLGGGVIHLPIVWFAPWAYGTLILCGVNYYRVHRKSHLDPEWARRKLPWHWDHHMGANQDLNWCVTWPLFDWVMGTRRTYFRGK